MYKKFFYEYFFQYLIAFILLIIIDQSTKVYTAKIMFNNSFESIELLPFLNIVFVRNTGISFGLFSDGGLLNRYFFTSFSIVLLILIIS